MSRSDEDLFEDGENIASVDVDELIKSLPPAKLTDHAWRQFGTELRCGSCPFTHSTTIPVDYQLYGIGKDGLPQFRKIVVH